MRLVGEALRRLPLLAILLALPSPCAAIVAALVEATPCVASDDLPNSPAQKMDPIKLEAEKDYWIDPDRPHISDSSVAVPKGLYLQENGFQQLWQNPRQRTFDLPESLCRLGVLNRTELRFNVPNYLLNRGTLLSSEMTPVALRNQGFSDIQPGFKHRFGPLSKHEFQIAVNPYISIPTGARSQSSNRLDYFIKFPFSQELNKHWDLEGMESFFFPTQPDGKRNMDWQNCIVLNRLWGRKSNVFIEYVSDVFQYGPMSNIIHFGGAYRPNRRQQFDIHFGFRMNNSAPIAFIGCGYSFLLGSLDTPKLTPSHYAR